MATPFNACGSVQDSGTYRGIGMGPVLPGQQTVRGRGGRDGAPPVRWENSPVGGEGTLVLVDPTNPDTVYASGYYNQIERAEVVNGRSTRKPIFPQLKPGGLENHENWGQWLAASILSPHDPSTLYHGHGCVYKSTDKGETWKEISPDLTKYDPAKQGKLPYIIYFAKLTALAESPLKAGVLHAGSDDGRVSVTMDDGATWTNISAGLPYYQHVWSMVASKYDPGTVYITLIGRHDDDFAPYVYKSTNYGKTWTSIAANLPGGPTNVIREDPKRSDVLYLGTDTGVFVTVNCAQVSPIQPSFSEVCSCSAAQKCYKAGKSKIVKTAGWIFLSEGAVDDQKKAPLPDGFFACLRFEGKAGLRYAFHAKTMVVLAYCDFFPPNSAFTRDGGSSVSRIQNLYYGFGK
jgi:hypothetical protein